MTSLSPEPSQKPSPEPSPEPSSIPSSSIPSSSTPSSSTPSSSMPSSSIPSEGTIIFHSNKIGHIYHDIFSQTVNNCKQYGKINVALENALSKITPCFRDFQNMSGTHSNFGQASVKVLETCRTKFMQEDVVKKGIPIKKFIYYAEVILIKLVHHCYYEMVINKSPQCFVNTAIDKILSSTKNDQDTPTIKIFTQELKSAEILKCVPKTIISHTLQHTELRHLDQIEDEEFTHTDHQQTPLPQGLVDALNTFYAPQASTSEFA